MYTVGRIGSYISRGVYTVSGPFHPFGGAVDIIVVEQPDGSLKSSPWYVRFGKFQGVLKTKEKVVSISVDGVEADFHMFLDHKGEAYFLKEVDGEEGESVLYPSSSGDETDGQSNSNRKPMNSKSFNFDADKTNSADKLDANNTKVVARTGSRRARIMGLVFGRKSMKEHSYRGGEGDASMLRLSSLERAEIAADLLEVKWSTNLASGKYKKDHASRFSVPDVLDDKVVKNMEVNDEKTQVESPVNDDAKNRTDDSMLHRETISRNEQMDSCSVSGSQILESSAVEASVEISCIDTMEHVVETSTLGESAVDENCDSGSEILESSAVEASVELACIDTMEQVVETSTLGESALEENCDSGSEILESSAVEASVEISCIDTMEQVVETSTLGESALEENCEILSEISRTVDEFGIGNADQACPDSQIQYELEACHRQWSDEEQTCDEKDETNPGCIVSKESGSDRVQSFVYCETSESSIVGLDGSNKQTQETLYLASAGCGEVHVHVETVHVTTELLSKDTDVKQAKHIVLEKEPVEVSDKMNPAPCMLDYNKTDIEDSLTVPESCAQVVSVDPVLCSTEELDLQNICSTLNVNSDVRDEINIMDDLHQSLGIGDSKSIYSDIVLNASLSNSPVESLEEEQFLFSDLDEFKFIEAQCVDSTSSACLKEDNDLAHCVEGIKVVNGSVNANDESCSSSDMFVQHNPSTDLENSMEISRVISDPIIVPRSHKAGEEVGRLVESLPNMWSPTIDLGADACYCPLSHSLDSNSKSLNWTLVKETDSGSMKSDSDKEQQLGQEQTDNENSQELKSVLSSPTVEISLCKHLLYEGMGANAAAQAFDAEKLDVDKFTSLGPVVLKNDRLVVRIGGHYFPWDVAAPFVLGMVAFGIKEIFELKGRIPVDRVEQTLIGDPSKTIVPSGGRWSWPFPFRRSRSRKAMQPALSDTKISDVEVASESINGMNEAQNVCKPRMAKKMIRAITPTSEQLASLNLKEGRNTVTFTFSTAMLGKQQVDARIYLWKWNTRIVISDVDGTITKSDVLGQFMPLVGIDWSQTGVAHLFSAIKENGYQLLFLSARAISQAYHTRQFLFNLKQDGKALPDGPVVISPDGVFPSLFREVIRRAPHEFKISCLEDIKALFPSDCNPFYAGFGNRDTDEISYLKVGIPRGKIFIINPKGEVAVSRRVDTKSYSSLHALVHDMFPSTISSEQEDFNSWNYWKLPPPDIDV